MELLNSNLEFDRNHHKTHLHANHEDATDAIAECSSRRPSYRTLSRRSSIHCHVKDLSSKSSQTVVSRQLTKSGRQSQKSVSDNADVNADVVSRLADGEVCRSDMDGLQLTASQRLYNRPSITNKKSNNELTKYKEKLLDYNIPTTTITTTTTTETAPAANTTTTSACTATITKKDENKCMKMNIERTENKRKQNFYMPHCKRNTNAKMDECYVTSTTSFASILSNDIKHSNLEHQSSFMTILPERISPEDATEYQLQQFNFERNDSKHFFHQAEQRRQQRQHLVMFEQENIPPKDNDAAALKDVYSVLKDAANNTKTQQRQQRKQDKAKFQDDDNLIQLYSAISSLKNEQVHYRCVIRHQQDALKDYHKRCMKAHEVMKIQKAEIEKLIMNNKELEKNIYKDLDELRVIIDAKLKIVAHLPQMVREERSKYEKAMRENGRLVDKLHNLQEETAQLKMKIDDLGRRKLVTINRLKAAERDLKIFKNYNAALKSEKQRLSAELAKIKEQFDSLQSCNKKQLVRNREASEKIRRELQKRIFNLELKLSRSQNSTATLIQERDSLIAELQAQLQTLVHNFEVSQKHIRVLRHHIYSLTAASNMSNAMGRAEGGVAATVRQNNNSGSHNNNSSTSHNTKARASRQA